MAIKYIDSYWAKWDLNNHDGYLWLNRADGGGNYQQRIENPQEFTVIIDLLRNEKPIRFDTSGWHILVGKEPVGEGE